MCGLKYLYIPAWEFIKLFHTLLYDEFSNLSMLGLPLGLVIRIRISF